MSLYEPESHARPQDRISITGLERPQLTGYVNATFLERGRIDERYPIPTDRSRAHEAAVRKAFGRFADLQLRFAPDLSTILANPGSISEPLLAILDEIRTTLLARPHVL